MPYLLRILRNCKRIIKNKIPNYYNMDINNTNYNDPSSLNSKKREEIEKNIEESHQGLAGVAEDVYDSVTNMVSSKGPEVQEETSEAFEAAQDVVEGAAVNTVNVIGEAIGVDPANKEEVKKELDQLADTINDPQVKEKIADVAEKVAENAEVALEAAKPSIDKMADIASKEIVDSGSKIGKAAVNVTLNTLEEIPGLGVAIGLVRNVDTVLKTGQSLINTTGKVTTAASDAVAETVELIDSSNPNESEAKEAKDLIQKGGKQMKYNIHRKDNILSRIGGAIRDFKSTSNAPQNYLGRAGMGLGTLGKMTRKNAPQNYLGRTGGLFRKGHYLFSKKMNKHDKRKTKKSGNNMNKNKSKNKNKSFKNKK